MENTGKNAVSCQYFRWQHRHACRYVSLPSQDETLVLCGRDAADIDIAGGRWILGKEQIDRKEKRENSGPSVIQQWVELL